MTQAQRDVYMALLMAGREDEATAYRDKVEAASYDSARARANANTYYVDKHGKKIEADMLISNRSLRGDPLLRDCKELYAKVFTLKQYADRRRSTDLTRFSFCPDCGKRIDWKSIAEEPRPP